MTITIDTNDKGHEAHAEKVKQLLLRLPKDKLYKLEITQVTRLERPRITQRNKSSETKFTEL